MKPSKARILCECAILLAMSVALNYIQFGRSWLIFGGAITPASMLPVALVPIRHGMKWGLLTAFCYSWFQILQSGVFAWGLTPVMLFATLFLDYILAFSVIGLSGLFRKHGTAGRIAGICTACLLRFFVHFLAGIILWANLEQFIAFGREWVNRPVLYSLCYNGSYMLPETVITVAVAVFLFQVPRVKRLFSENCT